jgi:leucyl/phenylalanyl-tRNA--protein transferase
MIWALPDEDPNIFPHPLTSRDGLLAFSETISAERVLFAYRYGIFPWYSEEDPMLWWYTQPRAVLFPQELKIHKSMRQFMNRNSWRITFNNCFEKVVKACQVAERRDQESTWIQTETIDVYNQLHHQGYGHSVEVWADNELIGGLYGLSIGKIFFGESMFSNASNASKVALIYLVKKLTENGYFLIDCQQETAHLSTLGARNISGSEFFDHLRKNNLFCLSKGDFHMRGV